MSTTAERIEAATAAMEAQAAAFATVAPPIGAVAPAALDGKTWLAMNGQVVSQATYASLFKLIGHQPEFDWKIGNAFSPGVGSVRGVAHNGSNLYVLVGGGGLCASSPDGIVWTARTSGVATDLNAVAWDASNSLFIAVGASNVILTSPDGITWTSRTSGVTSTLTNIVVAGGRAVAIGSSGWITYSTNGTSWTATQPNSSPSPSFLLYKGGNWFVGSTNGSTGVSSGIVYSTNGTTWNYVAKPTTNNFNYYGWDGTYHYLGDVLTGAVYKSTTGASWTLVSSTMTFPAGFALAPCWFSTGILTLIGTGSVYTEDGFITHKLAKASQQSGLPPSSLSIHINPGLDSVRRFGIIAGTAGLMVSADGKSWHQDRSCPPINATIGGARLAIANNRYFIGGLQSTAAFVVSAPEPYDPATQFQIPTRLDVSGNPLYIKALAT